MSISCGCGDVDGADWYWRANNDFSVLNAKRSKSCCSCHAKINPGDTVVELFRYREPYERCNYIEERIYGCEVPLASWFMCETCGGLLFSLEDLELCYNLDSNIKEDVKDWAVAQAEYLKRERERKERAA